MNQPYKDYIDRIRTTLRPQVKVEPDYRPSLEELNNVAYMFYKYGLGLTMRPQDFWVPWMVAGEVVRFDQINTAFGRTLAAYAKSVLVPDLHLTQEDFEYAIGFMTDYIFSLDQQRRQDMGPSLLDLPHMELGEYHQQLIDQVAAAFTGEQ
jgi:hypothetical protein